MMRALLGCLLALTAAPHIAAGARLSGGSFAISRHTPGTAGRILVGAGLTLSTSIGETAGRTRTGGTLVMRPGYIPLSSQPGTITAITALSKSTGTLELAWTAPGRDGFLGNVISGNYRIDFSSDPLHVFTPTTFRQEFSTTVVPGSLQTLTLSGLEVNTTYFTRIYLSDERKFFGEDSDPSEESTLANVPVSPVLAAINSSSVTITWTLPVGNAEGFDMSGSTTDFGGLLPGGAVVSSVTQDGIVISLTLNNLSPNSTFYFKVASLNWQGERNFGVVLTALTLASDAALPISNLAAILDPLLRTVSLTWDNPVFQDHTGVLVVLSTTSTASEVVDGLGFTPGIVLGDASVVKSTPIATSLLDGALALHTTFFYHVFTNNSNFTYSVRVSTTIFLDLAPMAPVGLANVLSADRTQFTLNWSRVTSSRDGTPFVSSSTPQAFELAHYEVFRATSVLRANWVSITTLPFATVTYVDTLPDPNQTFLYKVESVDTRGSRDIAMAVDTDENLYAFAPDQVTRMKVPSRLSGELLASGNLIGKDLLIRVTDQTSLPGSKIFRTTSFDVVSSPSNIPVGVFQFSRPDATVSLHYDTANGQVVPLGTSASKFPAGIFAADAADGLGMYWNNLAKDLKLYGGVDTFVQEVSVKTSVTGTYQIRGLSRTAGFHFDLSQITNKAITPNGDGLNDRAVFLFDNPRDSLITGKIFDITGGFITDMALGPQPNSLQWDGKSFGQSVPGGVYIYQIRSEDKVFNGTLVVIR